MNTFAGSITLSGNKHIHGLEFDSIESLSKDGNKNIYLFGETAFESSEKLIAFLGEKCGPLLGYDISISSEDKVKIVGESYEEGLYELASFEGEEVDFDEIYERFVDFEEVVSIREAEISPRFGNRVIKVDFVY